MNRRMVVISGWAQTKVQAEAKHSIGIGKSPSSAISCWQILVSISHFKNIATLSLSLVKVIWYKCIGLEIRNNYCDAVTVLRISKRSRRLRLHPRWVVERDWLCWTFRYYAATNDIFITSFHRSSAGFATWPRSSFRFIATELTSLSLLSPFPTLVSCIITQQRFIIYVSFWCFFNTLICLPRTNFFAWIYGRVCRIAGS